MKNYEHTHIKIIRAAISHLVYTFWFKLLPKCHLFDIGFKCGHSESLMYQVPYLMIVSFKYKWLFIVVYGAYFKHKSKRAKVSIPVGGILSF